jgi:hypothetical protein
VPKSPPRRPRKHSWESLSDDRLLALRFCDLKLSLSRRLLKDSIERLHGELAQRGILLRPHCWLAEEWFSPDGIPGIAIPFYLAHPRLMALERRFMREVEGGNRGWLMRILRHEAGHAVDSAYRLRRRRRWREMFGSASLPYPDSYRPRPASQLHVQHLEGWYAQAHPTEDFAETFAVWLKPRSAWRREYSGWPALAKLEYMDTLMGELAGVKPRVAARTRIEEISGNTRTLAQHYAQKVARYGRPRRSLADDWLLRIFTVKPGKRLTPRAASAVREMRRVLRHELVGSGDCNDYLVHQVLRLIIRRSTVLGLHVRGPRRELKPQLLRLLRRLAESYEERQLPRVAI